ncbi:fimbrillin family protein [Bacteroides sp. GD17]|uniref:fimbrillin family protein n=1 Tax=Bacteroides sp. GD17 TaxID=3139826 RepID=UPI0025F48604|nr:fimbrillin family protein [uncultured Bacteroides sp.]
MNYNNLFRSLRQTMHHRPTAGMFMVMLMMLAAAGCTDDADNDNRLPDGKYPMTFTAAVDGLTATRATTDNTWTGNEEVAIQIGSDGEPKKYIAASGGSLTVESDKEPFYWTNRTMNVSAWYSSTYTATKPATFNVQTNQSSTGYQTSDFLYAAPQDITFQSGGSSSELKFKHLPVKVIVNLKNEDSNATVTADEVSGATVSIVSQATASGTIADDGTVAQVTSGNATIAPNVLSSAASGYQKSVQALLVPQQLKAKTSFIKVSITNSGVEREYFYTPDADATLSAGQQYTYNITVKKEGLQVEQVSASWTDDAQNGDAESATFKIHLADFTAPTNTSGYAVTDANDGTLTISDGVYSTTSNEINISLSASDGYRLKKFLTKVTSGICKQKMSYTAASRTYTYTFYDIHSDLRLQTSVETIAASSLTSASPQVGDYYYSDGSWSAGAARDNSKNCIGIVFKVGNGGGNDALDNYGKFLTGGDIHGYVVALTDALSTAGSWGKRGTETPIDNVDNENVTAYTGYSDTKTIIDTYSNGTDWNYYQAFSSVVTYHVAAPDLSSGWYLPSLAQLSDVQSALSSISTSLTTAGGSAFKTDNDGRYWTSSELTNNGYDAWYIEMGSGTKTAYSKGETYLRPCYARAILTF